MSPCAPGTSHFSLLVLSFQILVCVGRSIMSDSLPPHGLYIGCEAPLSMGFSRQEYQSGLPFSSPRDLLDPGIESRSPASGDNSFHLIDMLMIKIMY